MLGEDAISPWKMPAIAIKACWVIRAIRASAFAAKESEKPQQAENKGEQARRDCKDGEGHAPYACQDGVGITTRLSRRLGVGGAAWPHKIILRRYTLPIMEPPSFDPYQVQSSDSACVRPRVDLI